MTPDQLERFWAKVDASSDGCWEWQASLDIKGYGQFVMRHRILAKAHRIGWEVQHGFPPGDLCVCHHCDNRKCVRGDHLFLGTIAENNHDRHRKGRDYTAYGSDHGRAVLTPQAVREIRQSDASSSVLAGRYGVHSSTIRNARRGNTWKHMSNAQARAITSNQYED